MYRFGSLMCNKKNNNGFQLEFTLVAVTMYTTFRNL